MNKLHTQNEFDQKIKTYELMCNSGLILFPAAGVNSDGTCTCSKGCACPSVGKHPLGTNWKQFSFQGVNELIDYCIANPNNNLAINCNGLCVIDVDAKNGGIENYKQFIYPLIANHPTLTVNTPSGGLHVYYRTAIAFKNVVGILPGIDIRSHGSLVIAPGSKHKNGGTYAISYSGTDKTDKINVSEIPKQLAAFLNEKISAKKLDSHANDGFVGDILEGNRNSSVFAYASALQHKNYDLQDISTLANTFNREKCNPPLEQNEVNNILKSIANYQSEKKLNWSEPDLNFDIKDPTIEDIKTESIPKYCQEFVEMTSKSIGVPRAPILVTVLTIMSALLGAAFRVKARVTDDYKVALNLWGIVVAQPSCRKTSTLGILDNVIKKIEAYFQNEREQIKNKIENNLTELKSKKKQLEKSEDKKSDEMEVINIEQQINVLKSKCVPLYLFKTSDSTPESMMCLFKDNQRGLLFFRDEMRGLFETLTKNGFENLRSLLTESWNGAKPYTITRVGRGLICVDSMTLSVLGGSQPDILVKFFADELVRSQGSDGLLARFQLIANYSPSQVLEPNDEKSSVFVKTSFENLVLRVHDVTKDFNQGTCPTYRELALSHEAFAEFSNYRKRLHKIISNNDLTNQAYRAHIGKFDRLVLSLAAQFHVISSLQKGSSVDADVSLEHLTEALRVAEYMDYQIKNLYFRSGNNLAAKNLVAKIKNGQIYDGMSLRQIYTKEWANLKTKDAILAAIESIGGSNWIQITNNNSKAGRPSDVIRLNPKLIEHLSKNNLSNEVEV